MKHINKYAYELKKQASTANLELALPNSKEALRFPESLRAAPLPSNVLLGCELIASPLMLPRAQ